MQRIQPTVVLCAIAIAFLGSSCGEPEETGSVQSAASVSYRVTTTEDQQINYTIENRSSGSISVSVPLELPPGRGQMAPVLSLEYSGDTPHLASHVGPGWTLSGVGSIHRCANRQRTGRAEVSYCVDGSPLWKTNFTTTYEDYRAEPSTGFTYRYYFGDDHWEARHDVEQTNRYYGRTENSRVASGGSSSVGTAMWLEDRTEDRWLNSYDLEYERITDAVVADLPRTVARPKRILYTVHPTQKAAREVEFIYDANDVDAGEVSWLFGVGVATAGRLAKIVIKSVVDRDDPSAPIVPVYEYRLTHGAWGRRRLETISKCTLVDTPEWCSSPLVFGYDTQKGWREDDPEESEAVALPPLGFRRVVDADYGLPTPGHRWPPIFGEFDDIPGADLLLIIDELNRNINHFLHLESGPENESVYTARYVALTDLTGAEGGPFEVETGVDFVGLAADGGSQWYPRPHQWWDLLPSVVDVDEDGFDDLLRVQTPDPSGDPERHLVYSRARGDGSFESNVLSTAREEFYQLTFVNADEDARTEVTFCETDPYDPDRKRWVIAEIDRSGQPYDFLRTNLRCFDPDDLYDVTWTPMGHMPVPTAGTGYLSHPIFSDFTGDGYPDVLLTYGDSASPSGIWKGHPGGGYSRVADVPAWLRAAHTAMPIELTGDGNLDFLVAYDPTPSDLVAPCAAPYAPRHDADDVVKLMVLEGTGTTEFYPRLIDLGFDVYMRYLEQAGFADFNSDGYVDMSMIVASGNPTDFSFDSNGFATALFEGTGQGLSWSSWAEDPVINQYADETDYLCPGAWAGRMPYYIGEFGGDQRPEMIVYKPGRDDWYVRKSPSEERGGLLTSVTQTDEFGELSGHRVTYASGTTGVVNNTDADCDAVPGFGCRTPQRLLVSEIQYRYREDGLMSDPTWGRVGYTYSGWTVDEENKSVVGPLSYVSLNYGTGERVSTTYEPRVRGGVNQELHPRIGRPVKVVREVFARMTESGPVLSSLVETESADTAWEEQSDSYGRKFLYPRRVERRTVLDSEITSLETVTTTVNEYGQSILLSRAYGGDFLHEVAVDYSSGPWDGRAPLPTAHRVRRCKLSDCTETSFGMKYNEVSNVVGASVPVLSAMVRAGLDSSGTREATYNYESYDLFGRPRREILRWENDDGSTGSHETGLAYDGLSGRLRRAENELSHVSEIEYDPVWSHPTSTTINGRVVGRSKSDWMGRISDLWERATGWTSRVIVRDSDGSSTVRRYGDTAGYLLGTSTYTADGRLLSTSQRTSADGWFGHSVVYDQETRQPLRRYRAGSGSPTITMWHPDTDLPSGEWWTGGRNQVQRVISEDGAEWSYVQEGRNLTVLGPRGELTEVTFDLAGNVLSTTEPADEAGGARGTTHYEYDQHGLVSLTIDANGSKYGVLRDPWGRVLLADHPDSGKVRHSYDGRGLLQVMENLTSSTKSRFEYDRLGRLEYESHERGGDVIWTRRKYDTAPNGIGRLARVESSSGVLEEYEYDSAGRVALQRMVIEGQQYDLRVHDYEGVQPALIEFGIPNASAVSSLQVQYSYDAAGALNSVQIPGDPAPAVDVEARDDLGRVSSVRVGGVRSQEVYDNNRLAERQIIRGVLPPEVQSFGWNSYGQLDETVQQDREGVGTTVASTYRYTLRGLLDSQTITRGGDSFVVEDREYDLTGQLVGINGRSHTRDEINGAHRYEMLDMPNGEVRPVYDETGSIVEAGKHLLKYDAGGRLTSIDDGVSWVSLGYGHGDIPVSERRLGTKLVMPTAGYVRVDDKVTLISLGQFAGLDATVVVDHNSGQHALEIQQLDSQLSGGQVYDEGGSLIESGTYSAGGRPLNDAWSEDPAELEERPPWRLGFATHGTPFGGAITTMGPRAYSAEAGVFLSPDPIYDMQSPRDLDLYGYAHQDPVSTLDMNGASEWRYGATAVVDRPRWIGDESVTINGNTWYLVPFSIVEKYSGMRASQLRRFCNSPTCLYGYGQGRPSGRIAGSVHLDWLRSYRQGTAATPAPGGSPDAGPAASAALSLVDRPMSREDFEAMILGLSDGLNPFNGHEGRNMGLSQRPYEQGRVVGASTGLVIDGLMLDVGTTLMGGGVLSLTGVGALAAVPAALAGAGIAVAGVMGGVVHGRELADALGRVGDGPSIVHHRGPGHEADYIFSRPGRNGPKKILGQGRVASGGSGKRKLTFKEQLETHTERKIIRRRVAPVFVQETGSRSLVLGLLVLLVPVPLATGWVAPPTC